MSLAIERCGLPRPPGHKRRRALHQSCAAQELRPDIAFQASAPGAVADLAGRGLGVAILAETMAAGFPSQLTAVPIGDIAIASLLALVWAPGGGPALRELLVHGRQAFARPPG